MLDFVLGFAFVAMILSPAAVASCLRHIHSIEPETASADNQAHARMRARRDGMRQAS